MGPIGPRGGLGSGGAEASRRRWGSPLGAARLAGMLTGSVVADRDRGRLGGAPRPVMWGLMASSAPRRRYPARRPQRPLGSHHDAR